MSYNTNFPEKINAGDSIQFAVKAYDSEGAEITNADGFTAYVILTNDTAKHTVSTTSDTSEGFLFEIATAVTELWDVGNYSVSIFADDATNRYLVSKSFTEVKPDLFSVANADTRSMARQIRDALEAAILGQATNNQLSMSIAGRAIQRMGLEELLTAKQKYDRFVADEESKQNLIDGKPSKSTINIRWSK